jgi:hypothetical protein
LLCLGLDLTCRPADKVEKTSTGRGQQIVLASSSIASKRAAAFYGNSDVMALFLCLKQQTPKQSAGYKETPGLELHGV